MPNHQKTGFRFSLAELMIVVGVVAVTCRWPITLSLAIPAAVHYLATKLPGTTSICFYRLAIPMGWLVAAWFSWHHPGDEYGMFIVSALPATWIMPLLKYSHFQDVLLPVFFAGAITTALAGWGMDRMRVRPLLWIALYFCGAVILVCWSLSQYPSYQKAMSKNGSLTAYISAAANLSLCLSVLGSVLLTILTRLIALVHNRNRSVPAPKRSVRGIRPCLVGRTLQ